VVELWNSHITEKYNGDLVPDSYVLQLSLTSKVRECNAVKQSLRYPFGIKQEDTYLPESELALVLNGCTLCICLFYDGISLGCLDFNQFVCFFA
jgi:hypothetical protein